MSRPLAAVLPLLLWTASHGCGGSSPAERQAGNEGPDARASTASPDRVALAIDTGQAEAVLAIAGAAAPEEAWRRLFDSEGHRLLEAREASMQRSFSQADFRSFALSAALSARAPALRSTLARWSAVDLTATARRVLPYLPAEARIAATVFPVIKPKENSFVFFQEGVRPSIFVFLDPAQTAEQFQNVIAHELHHIGFASMAEEKCAATPAVCLARQWSGGFGEGFAMLAAAGGPDVHPHRHSKPEDRARWDRDVARFDADLARVQAFLRAVAAGELDEADSTERGMEFFGVQGPWYTVGWTMAVDVERCLGRPALVGAMRRPWTVLERFNEAARRCPEGRATWDPALLQKLR